MDNTQIDFEGLATYLLQRIRDLLPRWLPGGHMIGHEYCCGDLRGGQGKSCKININTGRWADFASDVKGGDLISLYAAIQGSNQRDAALELIKEFNVTGQQQQNVSRSTSVEPAKIYPPADAPVPEMKHPEYGTPAASWRYLTEDSRLIFYMARYNTPDGKEFMPWTWNGAKWHSRAWPAPRPLYGLETLSAKPVLIVEGEKAADAARVLLGMHYSVVTWPGGAKAVSKIDWLPLHGRRVLIWPDADAPGLNAGQEIAKNLAPHCAEVKLITPDGSRPSGWDAADALRDQWTSSQVIDWAKANVQIINITQNNLTVNGNINVVAPDDDAGLPDETMVAIWERLCLVLSNTGNPICNEDNVARIFENDPKLAGNLWFDDFYNSVFLDDKKGGHEMKDIDIFKLTLRLQRAYGLRRIGDATVRRALVIMADRIHKNDPLDWLETLKWDGRNRLDNFFIEYMGAKKTPYVEAASKNFWISIVARIYNPGCIMRTMVILKSKQWQGKSTAFAIIGGKWYAEVQENIQSNNFLQSLHGKMILEFADMSGMDRADINRIKQVISCRMDRFRAPYDRTPADHPRQCVLVSTTNEGNFLRDDTGGSRFWPIETGTINHDKLTKDREQLFAEAVSRFKAGETWHIMPMEETEAIQESYRQTDEWERIIEEFLDRPSFLDKETTVAQIATECLKIPIDRLDKSTQIRIARNLTTVGWEKFQRFTEGRNVKVWRPKNIASPVLDIYD